SGEDENLAVGADFENRAAAVANVKVLVAIERDPGGNAHTLHKHAHVAVGRNLVDEAVGASGDVHHSLTVQRHARSIHQVVDERLHSEVQINLVNGDRDLLPARSAERGVDIAERIYGRIGHRMQAVGHKHSDVASPGIAGQFAAFDHQFPGSRAFRHASN